MAAIRKPATKEAGTSAPATRSSTTPLNRTSTASSASGARVLVLSLPAQFAVTGYRGRVADPDRLVRLAERDRHAASEHFAELFTAAAPDLLDWPDMLADDLRRLDPFALSDWAEQKGVRAETLSRGLSVCLWLHPEILPRQCPRARCLGRGPDGRTLRRDRAPPPFRRSGAYDARGCRADRRAPRLVAPTSNGYKTAVSAPL
jgi:hypothetical protein